MGVDCLERWLAKTFAAHSRLLLHHPLPFCIVPILVAAFLGYANWVFAGNIFENVRNSMAFIR
jgi:hypothetical protein